MSAQPETIRENLIQAGVKNMNAPFFLAMLDATSGKNASIDFAISELMGDIVAVMQ